MGTLDRYIRPLLEKQFFGVCTTLGKIMNVSSASIRLYFIYLSFLTFLSPVVIYLSLALFSIWASTFAGKKAPFGIFNPIVRIACGSSQVFPQNKQRAPGFFLGGIG